MVSYRNLQSCLLICNDFQTMCNIFCHIYVLCQCKSNQQAIMKVKWNLEEAICFHQTAEEYYILYNILFSASKLELQSFDIISLVKVDMFFWCFFFQQHILRLSIYLPIKINLHLQYSPDLAFLRLFVCVVLVLCVN